MTVVKTLTSISTFLGFLYNLILYNVIRNNKKFVLLLKNSLLTEQLKLLLVKPITSMLKFFAALSPMFKTFYYFDGPTNYFQTYI